MTRDRNLGVTVDGVAMADDEARALWTRFSDWMEEHRGDLAGFAAKEGFASIHPSVESGRPVLRASHQVAQRPYAVAQAEDASSGSGGRQNAARRDRSHRPNPKK